MFDRSGSDRGTSTALYAVAAILVIGSIGVTGFLVLGGGGGGTDAGDATPTPTPSGDATPTATATATPSENNSTSTTDPYSSVEDVNLSAVYTEEALASLDANERRLLATVLVESSGDTTLLGVNTTSSSEVTARYIPNRESEDAYHGQLTTIADSFARVATTGSQTGSVWEVTHLNLVAVDDDGNKVAETRVSTWWAFDLEYGNLTKSEYHQRVLSATGVEGDESSTVYDLSIMSGYIEDHEDIGFLGIQQTGNTVTLEVETEARFNSDFVEEMQDIAGTYGSLERNDWDTDALEVKYYRNGSVAGWYRLNSTESQAWLTGDMSTNEFVNRVQDTQFSVSDIDD